jgi:hypothetical protein
LAFLTPENIKTAWAASEKHHRTLWKPFDEWERVANNHPHPDIDKNYPQTTDGTTAGIVRATPKRVVQQVPSGKVELADDEGLECLANWVLTNEIIPHNNTQDSFIGKSWQAIGRAMTYGRADGFVFFDVMDGYIGTDFRIPFARDVFLEYGKGTFSECNFVFLRSWYQPSDIDAIIEKEQMLAKSAKKRGEKYESSWDLEALKEVKEHQKQKDGQDSTEADEDRGIQVKAIQLVHAFQKGRKAKFYTYAVDADKVVRTKVNPDPRGKMPVERMYYDTDLSNPEGRGVVELIAPLQNFIDGQLQGYQYKRAMQVATPLVVRGDVKKSEVQLIPNKIIHLGNNPNNSVEPIKLDTSGDANFSNDFGLFKSQMLNLASAQDTSVSATVGNPGFSKTSAGVNMREQVVSIDDNYLRKRYEKWISDILCTQLNIYFAEQQGDREFAVDDEELEKLAQYKSPFYDITPEGKVIVHFGDINDYEFDFVVEASSSKADDDDKSKMQLLEWADFLAKYGLLPTVKIEELNKRVANQIGVEDAEKLIKTPEEMQQEQMQAQEQQMAEMPQEQMQDGGQEMPQEGQELTPEEAQIMQNLLQAGYPEELAQAALQLEREGYPPEQIDEILRQAGGQ